MLEAVEDEREWRGEGATGESAAEDGEVPPRRESEEERGGCSGGRLRVRRKRAVYAQAASASGLNVRPL